MGSTPVFLLCSRPCCVVKKILLDIDMSKSVMALWPVVFSGRWNVIVSLKSVQRVFGSYRLNWSVMLVARSAEDRMRLEKNGGSARSKLTEMKQIFPTCLQGIGSVWWAKPSDLKQDDRLHSVTLAPSHFWKASSLKNEYNFFSRNYSFIINVCNFS